MNRMLLLLALPVVAGMAAATPAAATTPILWDITHGVYTGYDPAVRYSDLSSTLAALGYTIETTDAGIDNVDLMSYAILVIGAGSCWSTSYTASEAAAAQAYAAAGGSILILGDNPGVWPENHRFTMRNGGGMPGAETEQTAPLAHFRLVAESEAMDELASGLSVSAVKLFAVVRGARLLVTGLEPGGEAALLATVQSPRGRTFPYVALLRAESLGALEIVLPYPTSTAAGVSHFSDLQIATRAGRFAAPPIDEAAVRDGRTVAMALGAQHP